MIIAATDGVLDNIFDTEIQALVSGELKSMMGDDPKAAQQSISNLAQAICERAKEVSLTQEDPDLKTPFGAAYKEEHGRERKPGGKVDDIAIVCGIVRVGDQPPLRHVHNFNGEAEGTVESQAWLDGVSSTIDGFTGAVVPTGGAPAPKQDGTRDPAPSVPAPQPAFAGGAPAPAPQPAFGAPAPQPAPQPFGGPAPQQLAPPPQGFAAPVQQFAPPPQPVAKTDAPPVWNTMPPPPSLPPLPPQQFAAPAPQPMGGPPPQQFAAPAPQPMGAPPAATASPAYVQDVSAAAQPMGARRSVHARSMLEKPPRRA